MKFKTCEIRNFSMSGEFRKEYRVYTRTPQWPAWQCRAVVFSFKDARKVAKLLDPAL